MPVLSYPLAPHIERALAVRDSAVLSRRPVKHANERTCAAPGCTGGWMPPWKKRHRPIFEQEWACGTRCLARLVAAAVRRESGEGIQSQRDEPHRHRVPLGLVLLAQGWITHPQLRAALDAQRASGSGRIGDWLQQSCGLGEERIAHGLGAQWNCAVLATGSFSPEAMALVMPKRLVAEFGLVPLRVGGSSLLYLAFEEQMDAVTALSVERMSGLKVESGLLAGSNFASARQGVLEADAIPVQMKLVPDRDGLSAAIVKVLEKRQPLATRLVRVHQYHWLRIWLESGAMAGAGNLPTSTEDVEDYLFVVDNK
jgi:hypothetical protein